MTQGYRTRRPGPYRSRDGIFFGVCKGLADYFDISVFWLRVGTVAICFFGLFWPIVIYIAAGLLMKKAPILPLKSDADAEFYQAYASSRGMALRRLKRTYDNIERRIQRIESIVTARDYDWERRLNQ